MTRTECRLSVVLVFCSDLGGSEKYYGYAFEETDTALETAMAYCSYQEKLREAGERIRALHKRSEHVLAVIEILPQAYRDVRTALNDLAAELFDEKISVARICIGAYQDSIPEFAQRKWAFVHNSFEHGVYEFAERVKHWELGS